MEFVFLLKPIVDMLYEYQVIVILLMFICITFFSSRFKLTFWKVDYIVLIMNCDNNMTTIQL